MSDAPKKGRSWGWVVWALLGLAFLYVLSVGPAEALGRRGYISQEVGRTVYAPLRWLFQNSPLARRAIGWYLSLWMR
jgi:hypothetical protein